MTRNQGQAGDVLLRSMQLEDIPAVIAIERVSFPAPWSEMTYRNELTGNPAAHLYVAECRAKGERVGEIIGYVGFWHLIDEVHISTIAVSPEWRRRGFGKLIMSYALAEAHSLGATIATLEARVSNQGAIELYQTLGFKIKGRRQGYYRDTDEDALIMYKNDLDVRHVEVREKVCER